MVDKDIIIARLLQQVEQLNQQVQLLTQENQQLREKIVRLEKNSSNSSKPPSSDIINPKPNPKKGKKKKRGGQLRHKKYSRQLFTPQQIDETIIHKLTAEEVKHRNLTPLDKTESVLQQITLPDKLYNVIEHHVQLYIDPDGSIIKAKLPQEIRKEGLFTSPMTAFVGYLKAKCHMSYSTIAGLFDDVMELGISQSYLVKCCNKKLSNALIPAYSDALAYIRNAAIVGTDETGHKDSGNKNWTWCQHADDVVFFRICNSRGSKVLFENLGRNFNAILLADFFSANRLFVRLTNVKVQWRWAHLVRDIKFIAQLNTRNITQWADKLLWIIRKMLKTWRKNKKTWYFRKKLEDLKKLFLNSVMRPPDHPECRKIKKRFIGDKRDGYFLFLEVDGVEPTNNSTEQKIRFVVLDRRVTQGTNSNAGMRFYERMWTVVASCICQGKNIFKFLTDSLKAHYANTQHPSITPA
ncbi:MAG: IS66 family transposase [Sedimentisphaerales bacterium]|nr:IS66 family transposase [Sedimentisphaerales bacterium]